MQVAVIVNGVEEQRELDYMDKRTGLPYPVLKDGESCAHTMDGKVYILK